MTKIISIYYFYILQFFRYRPRSHYGHLAPHEFSFWAFHASLLWVVFSLSWTCSWSVRYSSISGQRLLDFTPSHFYDTQWWYKQAARLAVSDKLIHNSCSATHHLGTKKCQVPSACSFTSGSARNALNAYIIAQRQKQEDGSISLDVALLLRKPFYLSTYLSSKYFSVVKYFKKRYSTCDVL